MKLLSFIFDLVLKFFYFPLQKLYLIDSFFFLFFKGLSFGVSFFKKFIKLMKSIIELLFNGSFCKYFALLFFFNDFLLVCLLF